MMDNKSLSLHALMPLKLPSFFLRPLSYSTDYPTTISIVSSFVPRKVTLVAGSSFLGSRGMPNTLQVS